MSTVVREPSLALRAVLEIPLRFPDLDPALVRRAEALGASTRAPVVDWPGVYEEALRLVEQLASGLDASIDDMQRQVLAADPAELKQRLVAAPKRELERRRAELGAQLQAVEREWAERAGRQHDYTVETCVQKANESFRIGERTGEHGELVLEVDATWWSQFSAFVAKVCESWSESVAKGLDGDLGRVMASAQQALGSGARVTFPTPTAGPGSEARLVEAPPSKTADVPTTTGALFQYVRSNLMTVGIFGTVLGVVVTLASRLSGAAESAASSGSSMLLRGGLVIVVLPIVLAFGWVAARKQRDRLRAKAVEEHRRAVQSFLKSEVDKGLQKHRKRVEQFVKARVAEWANAFEGFWKEVVEQQLRSDESTAQAQLVEAKLHHDRLREAHSKLRSLRSKADNLSVDLKKRLLELRSGG